MNVGLNNTRNIYNQLNDQSVSFGRKKDNNKTSNHTKPESFWHKAGKKAVGAGVVLSQLAGSPTGVAVGGGALAGLATSCVEQNNYFDDSNIIDAINKLGDRLSQKFDDLSEKLDGRLKTISEDVSNIYKQMQQDSADEAQFRKDITALIKNNHMEQMAQGQEIIKILADSSLSLQEKMDKIATLLESALKELQKINEQMTELKETIIEIGKEQGQDTEKIIAAIDQVTKAVQNGDMTILEAMTKLEALLGKGNELSIDIKNKIQEAIDKWGDQGLSDAELLQKILDSINGIKDSVDEIKDMIKGISGALSQFIADWAENNEKIASNWDRLHNDMDALKNNADEQIRLQKEQIEIGKQGIQKADEMIGYLKNLDKKTASFDEWKAYLGPKFAEILNQLELTGNKIDIEQIIQAIKDNKTDMSTTNELLQTQISLLEKIANSGLSQAQMQEVVNAINNLQNVNHADSTAVQEAIRKAQETLDKISGGIDDINGKLDQLIQGQSELLTEFRGFKADAKAAAQTIINNQDAIKNGMVTSAQINEWKAELQGSLGDVKSNMAEQVATQKAILEKVGQGGHTREEWTEIIKGAVPNYYEILSNMNKTLDELNIKAGDMVTNTTLDAALDKYKVNLSTTNELIQTAISLLEKISGMGGGASGNIDTSKLESLNAQILDAIKNGQLASTSKLDELKEEIKNVKAAIDAQGSQGGVTASFDRKVNKSIEKAERAINALHFADIRASQNEDDVPVRYRANTYYGAFRA